MIHPSEVAAVWSIVVGIAMTGARAQSPEQPRPSPSTRTERPAGAVPPPPAPPDGDPFLGPPGLSEEAKRSFREIPPFADMPEEVTPDEAPEPPVASRSAPEEARQRPEYIVEPPDLILVEVLEALPGRPISGERLIRADGRISLGFYGEIPVAGLTLPQIKERMVLHLRKYINDETLGLLEIDEETGEIKRGPSGQLHVIDPRETDRVFVDVTAYNSKGYYVMGDVLVPGKLPYTGGETVLDAIQYAGQLLSTADKEHIRLIRSFPKGSPPRVLPINYNEIAMGTDWSTNYAMLPYDRLVVPGITTGQPVRGTSNGGPPRQDSQAAQARVSRSAPNSYYNRAAYDSSQKKATDVLEERIGDLEKKLDRLIQAEENHTPRPVANLDQRMSALESKLDELTRMLRRSLERSPGRPLAIPDEDLFSIEPPSDPDRMAETRSGAAPGPRRAAPREPRPAFPRPRRAEPGGSTRQRSSFAEPPTRDSSPFEDFAPSSSVRSVPPDDPT